MAYYFDKKTWKLNPEPPGVKVPTALALPLVAALGGALVVLLPIIGFGVALYAIGKRLAIA